jgi:hypothetical protein
MNFHPKQLQVTNEKRRQMLKYGGTALVAFVAGKIFGDHDSYFLPKLQGPVKEVLFENFKLTENEDEMTLSDKSGEPIFIVDKSSFR